MNVATVAVVLEHGDLLEELVVSGPDVENLCHVHVWRAIRGAPDDAVGDHQIGRVVLAAKARLIFEAVGRVPDHSSGRYLARRITLGAETSFQGRSVLAAAEGASGKIFGSRGTLETAAAEGTHLKLTLAGDARCVVVAGGEEVELSGVRVRSVVGKGKSKVHLIGPKSQIHRIASETRHGLEIIGGSMVAADHELDISSGEGFAARHCTLNVPASGQLRKVHFESVSLTAVWGSSIEASGTVYVKDALGCRLMGNDELEITGARKRFNGSVLMGIHVNRKLDETSNLIAKFSSCERIEFVLDDVGRRPWFTGGLENSVTPTLTVPHRRVGDLTHQLDDLARKKSRLGKTRTTVRRESLEYQSAEAKGVEGWFLRAFRIVGFAQTPLRPFLVWLFGIAMVLSFALDDNLAAIKPPCRDQSACEPAPELWELGIGLLLAPLSLFRGSGDSGGAGLPFSGASLLAARAGIGIPALILATAIVRTTATRRID